MPTSLIYAIVVLIWGTTWFVIKFQLGVVAPEISLVYRFGLAAACVFAYAKLTGNSLRLSWRDHRFVALQGATLFCLNYWMTYLSTQYLTSGLVAVLFTSIIFFNIVNGRMIFGAPIGGACGRRGGCRRALAWRCSSCRSCGRHSTDRPLRGAVRSRLPPPTSPRSATWQPRATPRTDCRSSLVNAYGMAHSAVGLAVIAAARGTPVAFDPRWPRAVTSLSLARVRFASRSGFTARSSSAWCLVPRTRAFCLRLPSAHHFDAVRATRGGACPQSWGSRCWSPAMRCSAALRRRVDL
jgi:hypothetical protein